MSNILFIGKKGDIFSETAAKYTTEIFPDALIVWSEKGTKIPNICFEWKGDYVFSYLSQWIIPQTILDSAKIAALNWHPGPTEYPGIGCTNFAIYNNEKVFGISCHHMLAKVDTGAMVQVKRFPILPNETVFSLTQKCYATILSCYIEILGYISLKKTLPSTDEYWTRKPYTRKQLNTLCLLEENMPEEEKKRRIRATKYVKHWAHYLIDGKKIIVSDAD